MLESVVVVGRWWCWLWLWTMCRVALSCLHTQVTQWFRKVSILCNSTRTHTNTRNPSSRRFSIVNAKSQYLFSSLVQWKRMNMKRKTYFYENTKMIGVNYVVIIIIPNHVKLKCIRYQQTHTHTRMFIRIFVSRELFSFSRPIVCVLNSIRKSLLDSAFSCDRKVCRGRSTRRFRTTNNGTPMQNLPVFTVVRTECRDAHATRVCVGTEARRKWSWKRSRTKRKKWMKLSHNSMGRYRLRQASEINSTSSLLRGALKIDETVSTHTHSMFSYCVSFEYSDISFVSYLPSHSKSFTETKGKFNWM